MLVALHPGHRSARVQRNVRQTGDTLDQIARHAGGEIRPARQHVHMIRV